MLYYCNVFILVSIELQCGGGLINIGIGYAYGTCGEIMLYECDITWGCGFNASLSLQPGDLDTMFN